MRLERLGNVAVSSVASQHKAGSPLLSMCLQVYFRYSGCLPESEYMKKWFEQVIQMLKCYCGGPCSSRYHRPTVLSCQKWRLNMLPEKKNKKQQINKTHIISAKAFSYRYACFFSPSSSATLWLLIYFDSIFHQTMKSACTDSPVKLGEIIVPK